MKIGFLKQFVPLLYIQTGPSSTFAWYKIWLLILYACLQVVKKPGVIIKPIKLAEVNPYDKAREPWRGGQTAKMKKNKGAGGKGSKNINMKNIS